MKRKLLAGLIIVVLALVLAVASLIVEQWVCRVRTERNGAAGWMLVPGHGCYGLQDDFWVPAE